MTKFKTTVVYFISTLLSINCYKILGIFPSLDHNNYLTYSGLFRELAKKNHEVTVISHFQMPDAPPTYNEVLLSENPVYKGLSFESVIPNEIARVPFETLVLTKGGNDECKMLMKNNRVLHMLREKPKYEVIIVESYNSDCGIALAANLSAPYITFSSQPIRPWQYNRLGIPFNSASMPQSTLSYGHNPWFFDRVRSFVLYHIANWVYYVGSQVTDHVYLYKFLGDELPCLESIASNASLMFVNTHQSVFGGTVRPDNVIDVGGIHLRQQTTIPMDVEQFINEAENGVIYVNLGSNVKDSTMPQEKLMSLLTTFRKLPLRVLWKWDGLEFDNLSTNILTKRWLPQYEILKNKNVKLFISNVGTLSTIEAIEAGKPVVAVPLFGDQYGNAAALRDADVATVVPFDELNEPLLLDAINYVFKSKCQKQAELLSQRWRDRPQPPMENAIYWTEYVARYQGAPNLSSASAQLPWYQQSQLDVISFIALVIFILLSVTYKILSCLCCCCCPTKSSDEETVYYTEERQRKRVKFE